MMLSLPKMAESSAQQTYWDNEHQKPSEIIQPDQIDPSNGVVLFYELLKSHNIPVESGIEMCCGKGRNVLGLARLGISMSGFDYSAFAIEEAKRRAKTLGILNIDFKKHDATVRWPYEDDSFTFGLDCFATADLEDPKSRRFAAREMARVLNPGGYLNVYTLSSEDEWSRAGLKHSPLPERNTYSTPEGKFEKCWDRDELLKMYKGLVLVKEKRISKIPKYNGQAYPAKHHWMVFQKPD